MPASVKVEGAQALDRALAIMRLVAAADRVGVRLTDLARDTGLAASTCHRLVRALEEHDYLERSEVSGRYHLGPELFVLGAIASERFDLSRAARSAIARIMQFTDDSVLLMLRRYWHVTCVERAEGSYPIRVQTVGVGDRHPLGVTAGGVAILATLPDDEVEQALATNASEIAHRFPHFSLDLIRECVAATRANGYAFNPGLLLPGSWGIAVSIRGADGIGAGAITVGSIQARYEEPRRSEVAKFVMEEVREIERRLQNPGSRPAGPKGPARARNRKNADR